MTAATPVGDPVGYASFATLKDADAIVRNNPPGKVIDEAVARAERAVARAASAHLPEKRLQELQGLLSNLKGLAQARLRDNVLVPSVSRMKGESQPSAEYLAERFSKASAQRNLPTVLAALESTTHWRSKAFQQSLMQFIEGNQRLPDRYRESLPRDTAAVLRACPHASGLVKELTFRGQRGATGGRSKLGAKSNSAIGSAYEIIGTAALISKGSDPSNPGAPQLGVRSGFDNIGFGSKYYPNRTLTDDGKTWDKLTRESVEADLLIQRPSLVNGVREIGVDFKHVKEAGTKYSSAYHKNQVENVEKVIRQDLLQEYHFVTNGTFSASFKKEIDTVNARLVGDGLTPIAYHEYVTTIVHDPLAGGEAAQDQ
jgi:hypothetical protein